MRLSVGQKAPDFSLPAANGGLVTLSQFRGKNVVMAFFPMAFTPIWTSQIPAYQADLARFAGMNTQVLGISVDHVPCLKAWAESLGGISYPLLSDFWPHGAIAQKYGVLRADGTSERAIFLIDRDGIIRYIDIHDIDDQPRNSELFALIQQFDPSAAALSQKTLDDEIELPHGGIVMYCTGWCPDCKIARAWFESHNLPYREVDLTHNDRAAAQVRAWAGGNEITPTFDIDGTILVDLDLDRLREVLRDRISE